MNEKLINIKIHGKVSILKIIIYVDKFLVGQNWSFKENNKIYDQQKLIETIPNFNDTTSDHINRIRSNMPHYLGVYIKNELSLLEEKMRHEISSM